jgi:hypothetical protein
VASDIAQSYRRQEGDRVGLRIEIMSGDLRREDADQEPELPSGDRAPVKKPMVQFLAEFEERLKSHPDEPATGAMRLVEQRAGGQRRTPPEAAPTAPAVAAPESAAGENAAEPTPDASAEDAGEDAAESAPDEGAPETVAASPGELRRLRGRRRRKHRHRTH